MICFNRSRFGATDAVYASGDETSRFQKAARFATDSSVFLNRKRSTPSTSAEAISPVIVRGFVPGRADGSSARTEDPVAAATTHANADHLIGFIAGLLGPKAWG